MGGWVLHRYTLFPCCEEGQSFSPVSDLWHVTASTQLCVLSWLGEPLHLLHHPHHRLWLGVKRQTQQNSLYKGHKHTCFFIIWRLEMANAISNKVFYKILRRLHFPFGSSLLTVQYYWMVALKLFRNNVLYMYFISTDPVFNNHCHLILIWSTCFYTYWIWLLWIWISGSFRTNAS